MRTAFLLVAMTIVTPAYALNLECTADDNANVVRWKVSVGHFEATIDPGYPNPDRSGYVVSRSLDQIKLTNKNGPQYALRPVGTDPQGYRLWSLWSIYTDGIPTRWTCTENSGWW
jgi:hypothetical protein